MEDFVACGEDGCIYFLWLQATTMLFCADFETLFPMLPELSFSRCTLVLREDCRFLSLLESLKDWHFLRCNDIVL